jgi:hypothetical protein
MFSDGWFNHQKTFPNLFPHETSPFIAFIDDDFQVSWLNSQSRPFNGYSSTLLMFISLKRSRSVQFPTRKFGLPSSIQSSNMACWKTTHL